MGKIPLNYRSKLLIMKEVVDNFSGANHIASF